MSYAIIIDICQSLTKEGKKPTTALVKTRLPHPLPLAQVLKGIQMFQANPNVEVSPPVEVKENMNGDCQCAPQLHALEQQISELRKQVTTLQVQVQALRNQ